MLDKVRRVAPTDASVLIYGETGTGKELIARAIHSASRRPTSRYRDQLAALPAGLVESELFGHEKGAFTGATGGSQGLFDWPTAARSSSTRRRDPPSPGQAAAGAAGGEFAGSGHPEKVDVRVIAATNRDLQGRPRKGVPRRPVLPPKVFPIRLPPLRDRHRGHPAVGDVPPGEICLFGSGGGSMGSPLRVLGTRLAAYQWPGNVRELKNILEASGDQFGRPAA